MKCVAWFPMLAVASLGAGCAPAEDPEALAAEIERQVVATHPDFSMERFARFYARESDGSITGVYLFANEGRQPPEGKTGEVKWTTRDKLPVVYDGGCAVVTVRYHLERKRLAGAECNVDA